MHTIQAFLIVVLCGFAWLSILLSLALALAEEVTIFDKGWWVKERNREGTIFEWAWRVKGRFEGGRVYDRHWNLEKRAEDGKIYDRGSRVHSP